MILYYNEFPYKKHFFENISSIDNLIKKIFDDFDWVYYKYNDFKISENEYPDLENSDFEKITKEEFDLNQKKKFETLDYLEKEIKIINSEEFEKEIDDYCDYLTIEFQHDIHDTFRGLEDRNRDIFFRNLLRNIDKINTIYSGIIANQYTSQISKLILERLIELNNSKTTYLKEEYSEFVPYLTQYFQKIKEQPVSEEIDIWSDIFKKEDYFLKFKEYFSKHIIENYIDISYLYQRMKNEKYLHGIKHWDFAKWLFQNQFINENTRDTINDERGFRSLKKSTSAQRENNFNIVFKI